MFLSLLALGIPTEQQLKQQLALQVQHDAQATSEAARDAAELLFRTSKRNETAAAGADAAAHPGGPRALPAKAVAEWTWPWQERRPAPS